MSFRAEARMALDKLFEAWLLDTIDPEGLKKSELSD